MAKVIVTESYLENIGDAIRSKLGTQDTYSPSEMAGAISQIHGDPVLEALSVMQNGTYNPSSGKDGFSQAVVNVPNSYSAGDEGKVVSNGALVAQTSQSITENGTYDTTLKNEVVVNVAGSGIPIISEADWENMTTAEKQSYGLIIIQTASQGFKRGDYVNGADYIATQGVKISTKSTGGYDASVTVKQGYWDESQQMFVTTDAGVDVLYSTVQQTPYDCAGIAELSYNNGWKVVATDSITNGTRDFENGDTVQTWTYNQAIGFSIWHKD